MTILSIRQFFRGDLGWTGPSLGGMDGDLGFSSQGFSMIDGFGE